MMGKRCVSWAVVGLVVIGVFGGVVHAQVQPQPPLLDTPVQYNPINIFASASGLNTATATIPGATGQRVRIYSVIVVCNSPGTTTVPTLIITDAGNIALSLPNQTISIVTTPVVQYRWSPGFAMSIGGTVVVQANYGAACGGGTSLFVQADQF